MRPAFRMLASAGFVTVLALTGAHRAVSENAQIEDVDSDGSQIVAAGAVNDPLPAKNLNTVPVDGFSQARRGPDNALIRKLEASRPNEDLVICIAGCFSGRDRVVYAQPIDRSAQASPAVMSAIGDQSSNGASDGTGSSVAQSLRGSK